MEIRKGPYGHYAVRKIEDIDSIHDYTRKIVAENILGHMLPLYIIPTMDHYEASYDFSGLTSLFHTSNQNNNPNKLRKAIGDLLYFLSGLPDYLLSPASVLLDINYIFTDEDYSELKVCFDPVKVPPEYLNIGSISKTEVKTFLNSDIVSTAVSPSETDSVIYAIEQNDPELLRKAADVIRTPVEKEKKQPELLENNEFKMIILLSLLSLIFAITKLTVLSLISESLVLFFSYRLWKSFTNKPEITVPHTSENTKKQMLFGDESEICRGLNAVILTSRDPATNQDDKKAIYTDDAVIGSDRFLCDIFTPDKGISPMHARIKKSGRTYYVSDLSSDNSTFLNDMRLDPGRDYEIKSGQSLMCGNREFQIDII